MTCLSFTMIPSITTMSFWNIQYVLTSCSIWTLFSGQPMTMYHFSHCKLSSCEVACCNCLLTCTLGCLSLSVWCQPSLSCQVFLHLCFPYGCVWKASLWQCCNIFSEYCYKYFMICYYTYLPVKAVVAESIKIM